MRKIILGLVLIAAGSVSAEYGGSYGVITPAPVPQQDYVDDGYADDDYAEDGYSHDGYADDGYQSDGGYQSNGGYQNNGGYQGDGGNTGGDYSGQPAQCSMPRPPSGQYEEILRLSNGTCDTRSNPHSLGCVRWNYGGNQVFPLARIDWDTLQGEWFATTYVSVAGRADGPYFYMPVVPSRQTQPMGVYNDFGATNPVGSMYISGQGAMSFGNWQGFSVATDVSTYGIREDGLEYRVQMQADVPVKFECRDFLRNNNHHLLCLWYRIDDHGTWVQQGYLGFIKKAIWDQFMQCRG